MRNLLVPGKLPPARFLRHAGGASAVEFALIAPVFLMMIFGMIAYAIYFGAAHSLQQLAADATRTSVAGLSDIERHNLVTAFISANADGYILIDNAHLSVEAETDAADSNEYRVALVFDASQLPIWNLHPPIPLPSSTLRFASSIRKGGI